MSSPNKKEDILLAVINSVESGNLRLTFHVLQRMKERRILLSDVYDVIFNARREENKDEFNPFTGDWKYAIRGLNSDGDKDIRLILVFKDPATLILTVIDLNQ